MPRLLRLAAFLHDIGKGHGGDHAGVGAEIATAFAKRMGLDTEPQISWSVPCVIISFCR